jgi:hypothetical protein
MGARCAPISHEQSCFCVRKSGSDQSGRPDLNRRPLDPQECIYGAAASRNVRLRRSGCARASKLKQLGAPLSRTRSHLRSHPCTWQRQASGARFAIRNADLFGSAASPTVTQPSLRDGDRRLQPCADQVVLQRYCECHHLPVLWRCHVVCAWGWRISVGWMST